MGSGTRPPGLTEAQLQATILEAAGWHKWLVYHTHDSRRSAAGYPDLTLARGTRLVFAELKSAKGKVTHAQQAWLDALAATGAEVYVWRPPDLAEALRILR